jgi:hypothetical protein
VDKIPVTVSMTGDQIQLALPAGTEDEYKQMIVDTLSIVFARSDIFRLTINSKADVGDSVYPKEWR